MIKSLIIGKDSYLASNYINKYNEIFSKIVTFSYQNENPKIKYDLFKPDFRILDGVINSSYKYAIIFAGISNVAFCEDHKEYTNKCNVEGVINTSKYFISNAIVPIIFSSDYVFDGQEGNYSEKSSLSPSNEYGRQKARLESYMLDNFEEHCIVIRLSKVFDSKLHKKNFLGDIIGNLVNKKSVKLVFDQIFSPIYVDDVINIIFSLQKMNFRGLINVCGNESIDRYTLGQKVSEKYNIDGKLIKKISIDDLKENFKRPKNISMNNKKLCSLFDFNFKSIDSQVEFFLK